MTYAVLGHPTGRAEGPDKVTGRGKYGVDILLPGTLWCKFLRSPYPHARILSVDASQARRLPGVHAVLTGADVIGMRTGRAGYKDEPLLCWDRVLVVGDKVAAAFAEDEETAEHALDLIEVRYEELPALLTVEEAAKPGAPLLHPDLRTYAGVEPTAELSNIYAHLHREKGNVEEGFRAADLVVEGTYRTPWQHQAYLEPHNCQVWIDPAGRVQVWVSCQLPMINRTEFARLFQLPPEQIVFNASYLGGSFGGKTDMTGAALCYIVAKATGRPVKYVMDYSEELTAMNPRHPSVSRVKAGVTRDGTLTAWQAEIYLAAGAYAAYGSPPPMGLRGVLEVAGPYRVPHVRLDSYQVYTNTTPCGAARAPGMPQGIFAGESHMDVVARAIGMDPHEFRLKNFIHEGEEFASGHRFQSIRVEETLRAAAEASGYFQPKAAGTGRGIAVGNHSQGGGAAHAAVAVHPDGRITANLSTFDPGGGTQTLLAQIVAEELGVSPERVQVTPWSGTDEGPLVGVGGSRGARVTSVVGNEATQDLRRRLRQLAAELYGWAEERVAFQGGDVVNGTTGQRVPLEQLAARAGGPVAGRAEVTAGTSTYTSFGVQVAEVHVDPETGQVRLLRLTTAHETGTVLNPISFHGQVEGGVVYGMGEALMEELVYDEGGRVTNPSFAEMKIPSIRDIPELRTVILESSLGEGPYGVRGIGEHSNIMTAAAIANAIEDACGARLRELPITAEKVYAALKGRRRAR